MSFLVLLLAVWVEKFSAWRSAVQQDGLWLGWLRKVQQKPDSAANAWLAIALLVVLPLVALGVAMSYLQAVFYGWLLLPLHLLVLIYSLGRGDLQAALGPFRDNWRRGDSEAAYLVAQRDLGIDASAQDSLLNSVQNYLIWQGFQSFFAVIFWYALLGPMAALAYRLIALLAEHAEQPLLQARAEQLRHAVDWLPARALALSLGLVGNFVGVSRALLHELLSWDIHASILLGHVARSACATPAPVLGEEGVETLYELWQLLVRAAVLWYAVFAIFTLFF